MDYKSTIIDRADAGGQFREPMETPQGSSEDEKLDQPPCEAVSEDQYSDGSNVIFGSFLTKANLSALHPSPVHIFTLWQTFLDNVNPLVKILHAPTVQQIILQASANLEKISKGNEALMFAIYAFAVTSLTNAQCESIFNETKPSLLARYQQGVQQALLRAEFLKSSELVVLQAFVLFLVSWIFILVIPILPQHRLQP